MKQKFKTGFKLFGAAVVIWMLTLYLSHLVTTSRIPVEPSTRLDVFPYGDSYVKAEETWVIENEKSAYPLQTSNIKCDKTTKTCEFSEVVFGANLYFANCRYLLGNL